MFAQLIHAAAGTYMNEYTSIYIYIYLYPDAWADQRNRQGG